MPIFETIKITLSHPCKINLQMKCRLKDPFSKNKVFNDQATKMAIDEECTYIRSSRDSIKAICLNN